MGKDYHVLNILNLYMTQKGEIEYEIWQWMLHWLCQQEMSRGQMFCDSVRL
jgi:hypothetical protein